MEKIIKRSSTPKHLFRTNVSLVNAEKIYIVYAQQGQVILEKTKDDIEEITDHYIKTKRLSQEDTLLFDSFFRNKINIQVIAVFPGGETIVSNIMKADPKGLLKEGPY